MKKKALIVSLIVLVLLACNAVTQVSNVVEESGSTAKETRSAPEFHSVELAGSADVDIRIGEEESVVVEAAENILPLIEINVRDDTLVISTKPGTQIITQNDVRVVVTMPSLESATISGSGNITMRDLHEQFVAFRILGSGNITAIGAVESMDASIRGSGNIIAGDLVANTATVQLPGSGNVTVYADESLTATIGGSGTIRYLGDPVDVNTRVTGSGTISPAK